MANTDMVTSCIADLKDKVKSVATLGAGKVFEVYDQEELEDRAKDLKRPCAGVVYLGIRKINDTAAGMGTELVCAVVVIGPDKCEGQTPLETEKKKVGSVLDAIRDKIKGTKSPSGHKWVFQMEVPADLGPVLGYIQRWSTKVMIVQ